MVCRVLIHLCWTYCCAGCRIPLYQSSLVQRCNTVCRTSGRWWLAQLVIPTRPPSYGSEERVRSQGICLERSPTSRHSPTVPHLLTHLRLHPSRAASLPYPRCNLRQACEGGGIRVKAWTESRHHRPLFTEFTFKNRGKPNLLHFNGAVSLSQLHQAYQELQGDYAVGE